MHNVKESEKCEVCENSNITFDWDRLKKAVDSPTIEYTLPKGASREEIRQFIINSAKDY